MITHEDKGYCEKHALPVCLASFVALAERVMHNDTSGGEELAEMDSYQCFRPYFIMLRESSMAHRMLVQQVHCACLSL